MPSTIHDHQPLAQHRFDAVARCGSLTAMKSAPVLLIVDAANVVGAVPDGWWRDRVGAARRLRDALVPVATEGLGSAGEGRAAIAPPVEVVLVVEGAARGVESVDGVRVIDARGSGDDTIVALVNDVDAERHVVVVTADRELRRRIDRAGVRVLGPRSVPRTPL
jgi:hypothetical protein